MKIKRGLALLVISAFLISLLPMGNATSASAAGGTTRAGYGLKNPTTDSNGVVTWDCVWFGNYWQEDTNGDGKADKNDAKQPIKWRVLSVNGDDAFLLADKNLDCQKYNDTDTSVTWETCTMRSWLNGYGAASNKEEKDYSDSNFLDYAFSSTEQSAIRVTNVNTEGGDDTSDKVYLLSLHEVMNPSYGFTSKTVSTKTRQAVNTSYVADGGEIKSGGMCSAGKTDVWWIRSPGYFGNYASYVYYNGECMDRIDNFVFGISAVRPALHLNLSSDSGWSYAGTVISKGGEIELAKIASLKLTQKKRTVTVSWKKVGGATGYQIWYSTSKKWKGKKQKAVSENKVTVKNLKKKKTYYFRVRALRWDAGGKVYGAWSKTKKITMKR